MSAFSECQTIEMQGYHLIKPYLAKTFDEFVYVNSAKRSELMLAFQTAFGDLIARKGDALFFIDLKTEVTDKYGNLFLETFSNKSTGKPGWFVNDVGVKADFIYYIFLEQKCFYIMDLARARKWAYEGKNLERYPEKVQGKYRQLNDTWGRCVKIADLVKDGICVKVAL